MKIKKLLKDNGIRAQVLTNWGHLRCKFQPGDWAKVRGKGHQMGTVVAVSTVDGEHIRSANRGHTRYFLAFRDGGVRGYDSARLVHA
jgi:hypothetical protein